MFCNITCLSCSSTCCSSRQSTINWIKQKHHYYFSKKIKQYSFKIPGHESEIPLQNSAASHKSLAARQTDKKRKCQINTINTINKNMKMFENWLTSSGLMSNISRTSCTDTTTLYFLKRKKKEKKDMLKKTKIHHICELTCSGASQRSLAARHVTPEDWNWSTGHDLLEPVLIFIKKQKKNSLLIFFFKKKELQQKYNLPKFSNITSTWLSCSTQSARRWHNIRWTRRRKTFLFYDWGEKITTFTTFMKNIVPVQNSATSQVPPEARHIVLMKNERKRFQFQQQ